MDNQIDKKVVIIGAGLTGLTAAYYLKKSNIPFVILEKEKHIGGVINTHYEDGFIYEAGPNSGVLGTPEAAELIEELNEYCKLEIANSKSKQRWIWKNNRWEKLPSGLIGGISTPLFKFKDKLNILAEPFRKPGNNPNESVAELVKRRMGQSFLDYAVDPFISGIYAGDPSKLITKYALPKLYNLEQNYGSFIKGSIKKAREPKTEFMKKATREVFSIENGLINIINALVKKIGIENIKTECSNIKILSKSKPLEIEYSQNSLSQKIKSDYIITTIGAHSLQNILNGIDNNTLSKISNLKYARVVQVSLGFKKWEGIPLNAFGGLVPEKEKKDILGILFLSSIFKNRAPIDGALISVFIGGVKREELVDYDDDKIYELVNRNVSEMLKLPKFNPDLIKIKRYEYAIPQYEISTKERYEAIDKIQNFYNGLILAGNIRDGIGMADRMAQGRKVADLIFNKIKQNV